VISLEERAKVTEALEAILDEWGGRLSATDIVRLKAGWETQSCEVGLTPAPLVICPTHTIFYKRRSDPIGRDRRPWASVGTEVMTALEVISKMSMPG
jgi:hypothetical protein